MFCFRVKDPRLFSRLELRGKTNDIQWLIASKVEIIDRERERTEAFAFTV